MCYGQFVNHYQATRTTIPNYIAFCNSILKSFQRSCQWHLYLFNNNKYLAYLIYLWRIFLISNENISENFILFLLWLFIIVWSSWFLFNFNFKKESKELYVVISCFLSLYCMFTVISNDNPDKTKTSASVTDSRVQTADIYFKYEIFYTIWLKIIF